MPKSIFCSGSTKKSTPKWESPSFNTKHDSHESRVGSGHNFYQMMDLIMYNMVTQ